MKVMTKTLIVFFITTLLLIGTTHILIEVFVMSGFLQNEATGVKENMEKVAHAIDMEFNNLEKILIDWSEWDDTYQFIVDRNEEYINSNLGDETLIALDLNLMVFVNSSNEVVFGKAVDLYTGEEARIPDVLLKEIRASNSPLLTGSGTSGLILTEQGPMMVLSNPILKSNGEGPPRGFLIFGRYFDEVVLRRAESLAGFNLLAYPIRDSSSLSTGEITVRPINESFISGSYTMTDLHGQPILTVQGEIPRILYQQGRLAATQFLILFTSFYIILEVVIYALLNTSIFSRLKKLETFVKNVGRTSKPGERLSLAGDDELSSLNASINEMLDRLDLAKKSLMESEKRLKNIFEGTGTALALTDKEMRIILINTFFEKLFGYSKDEVEGKISFAEVINEEDYPLFLTHQKKALEGESVTAFEARVKDKYGNAMFCLVSISTVPETQELIVSFMDISKKKILEMEIIELLEEMRWLDEIINKSPAIAFMWRAEEGWPVDYVSNNIQQFGYMPKDFVSGKIKYAEIIHPDDLERVREEVMEYTRKGLEEFAQEYRIVTAGGDIRWVYDRTWLKRSEDGTLTHYQGVILDISERKWMEEQIKKYSEELEKYSKHLEELVEERTKELREKERLAAIGQTAIMVGHDLRNPLQVMKNILYILNDEVMKAEFDPKLKIEILERLKVMDRQIWYMNKIVLDLQDLSKEKTATPTLVNPMSLLEELVEQVPSNIKVVMDLDQKMTAFLDEYILRRVCSNLILNAIQAMPNGGTLKISAHIEGGYFVMKISDTGAGIPKEVLDKLFTPFFTTKAKGMGLGLAVSKKLVEIHGGTITVESEVGKGTTFTIKIPQRQ
ncbi:MAG: PAS domain S-box protein [Candidatus Methanomethyliales bacterium]|nr:PAS domain S-box protein [Candidatus Methanomethylicales archaeon]